MDTFIIKTESSKTKALITMFERLGLKFELKTSAKKNAKSEVYDQAFVAMVLESKDQIKAGKFKSIETDDLWK